MTPSTRLLAVLAAFIVAALPPLVPPAMAQAGAHGAAPHAGRHVTVSGPEIRLGDIFPAAGARAGEVVASAPAPGGSVGLDAATLSRLARAYGIHWQPGTADETLTIGRDDALPIDGHVLAEAILAGFAARGVDLGGADLSLTDVPDGVRLPATSTLTVERLSYRPPARAFAAVVKASEGERVIRRLSVSGEIRRSQAVPVLTRPIARGETIGAADLHWIDADEARLPVNAVVSPDAMVGLVVRRNLKAGQPILAKDLAKPLLVEKNALVTLILSRPGMQLTARGRALADAGLGDRVSVVNLQSNLVVAGTVTAAGTVSVAADGAGVAPASAAAPRTSR